MKKEQEIFLKFKERLKKSLDIISKELHQAQLKYTNEEIDRVHDLYSKNFSYPEKLNLTNEELKTAFFAYCYNAYINSNGGELILDTNKRSIHRGKPIIVNYGGKDYPWAAVSIDDWIKRIEESRFKGLLSEAINRDLKDKTL